MAKKVYQFLPYGVILLLGAAIVGLLFYIIPYRYGLTKTVYFEESDEKIENPLTGFAPPAEEEEACAKTQLVYIGLTWAEWEPQEGVYDIAGLEETYHIARWKKENKHAVLRFICDLPGEEKHRDIPQWLYEKTKDGAYYSTEYGRGYAPDYSNPVFAEYHAKAIEALARYCNQDTFVSYVELGSLGHWGEWHTYPEESIPQMPDAQLCWQYVLDYTDSFQNARMLMRRNYVMAQEGGLGLFNDMTGAGEDTQEWLGWIEKGGSQATAGEELPLKPMEGFWKRAPVGGELTSAYPMEELMGKRFVDTIELIEKSHMSFLGPKCPSGEELKSDAAQTIRESLGYRIYISELRMEYSFRKDQIGVKLVWKNTGLAPMYWDWPVTLYVYGSSGKLEYWKELDLKLSDLVPGEEVTTETDIPFSDSFRKGFRIAVSIKSPDGKESIRLAMDEDMTEEGMLLYSSEDEME